MQYAKDYIYIILIGNIFNMVAFTLNNTIRGDGNPKLAATIMIIGCLTNIVLDAVLIFVFNLGIQGAAIATVISQLITALIGLRYYVSGKSNLKFEKSTLKLDKAYSNKNFSYWSCTFCNANGSKFSTSNCK